jgi:hypothetical protein
MGLCAFATASLAFAQEGPVPKGIPHMDHVFVIMMENHGFQQIIGNPDEPYLNSLIGNNKVSLAKNYFAVGHPSLTNYLEIVGGSNFGVRSDNAPDWGDKGCSPNIATGIPNADNGLGGTPPITIDTGNVCPIFGKGTDAETPAVDTWNEALSETVNGQNVVVFGALADIDGVKSVSAEPVEGKTIADQLVHHGLSWKSYQESLPLGSPFGVNYSNGTVSNLTDFSLLPGYKKPGDVVQAYAVKHNPFAYFKNVQEGWDRDNSLENVVGFEGPRGLYADLATGDVPNFSFIAPNQCNDQHGRGNGDKFCAFDPGSDVYGVTYGTQAGLNPGLILQGDTTIERIVKAIHASRVWHEGRNAIVIVWDENDYSGLPTAPPAGTPFPPQNQNQVVLTVEVNQQHDTGVQSTNYYNSFSLLRSLEAGFHLPCLNHACDAGVQVMSDLFDKDADGY